MMNIAKETLYALLNLCKSTAEKGLRADGSFIPFGVMIKPGDKISVYLAGGLDGENDPVDLYGHIAEYLASRARDHEITAAAIVVDVNIPEQLQAPVSDGVRIQLEVSQRAQYIYLPYVIGDAGITFYQPVGVETEPTLFPGDHA